MGGRLPRGSAASSGAAGCCIPASAKTSPGHVSDTSLGLVPCRLQHSSLLVRATTVNVLVAVLASLGGDGGGRVPTAEEQQSLRWAQLEKQTLNSQ